MIAGGRIKWNLSGLLSSCLKETAVGIPGPKEGMEHQKKTTLTFCLSSQVQTEILQRRQKEKKKMLNAVKKYQKGKVKLSKRPNVQWE